MAHGAAAASPKLQVHNHGDERMSEQPPAEVYALALVVLMDRTNTHHLEIDLENLDRDKSRGLALNIDFTPSMLTFSTGRCECPKCVAVTGAGSQ